MGAFGDDIGADGRRSKIDRKPHNRNAAFLERERVVHSSKLGVRMGSGTKGRLGTTHQILSGWPSPTDSEVNKKFP